MRLLLALMLLLPLVARAEGGPIRMIVPFAPGGASDSTARIVVPGLAATLGRAVVIENRPGAGGMLGAEAIARAAPDGTTLGISNSSPEGIVPLAQERPPYDSDRDFTHIVLVAETPTVLLVPAGSRFRDFATWLRAAASWERGLSFASTGIGSLQHLQGVLLARLAGARLTHVPYRGTAPALQDLVAGQVDSMLTPLAGTVGAIAGGQARALAVSSAEPFAALPGVPTYASLGFPQLTATSWTGISGPRGLPAALVTRINEAVNRVTAEPDVVARLEAAGLYPPARRLDPAAFQRLVADFAAEWGPVVRAAGLRPE